MPHEEPESEPFEMPSPETLLSGLDGSNPLAFLAALGLLRALDHRAREHGGSLPRLSWVDEGVWRPVIHGEATLSTIIGQLIEDRASWEADPALLLAYDDSGENLLDPRKAKRDFTRDLKCKPGAMQGFFENLATHAEYEQSHTDLRLLRRALDTAAAYGSEVVQDNNGNTKPTAFHFTAGQQQFLKAIAELQEGISECDLQEALKGPWRRESPLPNMGWDATDARFYALRATNPSGDKKASIAGADWLAFVGLGMLPSFPCGSRLVTTGIRGGWKDSVFSWAVWERPASLRVVCSILRTAALHNMSAKARRARGIGAVFSARINRSDQGGYGSFSPAQVR